jgi:hypothetical protein
MASDMSAETSVGRDLTLRIMLISSLSNVRDTLVSVESRGSTGEGGLLTEVVVERSLWQDPLTFLSSLSEACSRASQNPPAAGPAIPSPAQP